MVYVETPKKIHSKKHRNKKQKMWLLLLMMMTLFWVICGHKGGFPGGCACNAGDLGSIPRLGRSPEEECGNPLYFFAWSIPRTEEPGELHPWDCKELSKVENQNCASFFNLNNL